MTDKNTKKKGLEWFRSFSSEQEEPEQETIEKQLEETKNKVKEQLNTMKESEVKETQKNTGLLSKDNQDKVVLDSIIALENMVKDRQLLLYTNKDINNQLLAANKTINHMKQDLVQKDQLLLENNKQILGLEDNLTKKQMSYDQLIEDYKEYQSTSNTEYEKISIQLDREVNKYTKLNEELVNFQNKSILKTNQLEEKVRSLETENKQYGEQYEKVMNEKTELMKTINDFTNRMSFSLSNKATIDDSSDDSSD